MTRGISTAFTERTAARSILSALVASTLALTPAVLCAASGDVLGVASASGAFRVDHSTVEEHATILEGSVVEAVDSDPRLQLKDGAWIHLASGSAIRVKAREVSVESGIGEVGSAAAYVIEAKSLRIRPSGARSVVRVQVEGDRRVTVAAYGASAGVFNRQGMLVANVHPGSAVRFDPYAAAGDAASLTGCLLRKEGKFILVYNPADRAYAEVAGAIELAKELGNRVTAGGTVSDAKTTVTGAIELVTVKTLTRVAEGGCVATAADIKADAPRLPIRVPATVPAATASSVPYIIGGVAAAGAGGGVIAATSKGSTSGQ